MNFTPFDQRRWIYLVISVWLLAFLSILTGCGAAYMGQGTNHNPARSLVSVTVSPQTPEILLGKTIQLSATAVFNDGSKSDVTNTATWVSAHPEIATIGGGGVATSKATGKTSISAVFQSAKGSSTLVIDPAAILSIVVTPPNPSLTPNSSVQLIATGTFTDGSTRDVSSAVIWSTVPSGVVSLTNAGLATARSTGTVAVTATKDSINGGDTLTVAAAALVSIAVSPQNVSLTPKHSGQLKAVGTYNDATTQDISNSVIWSAAPNQIVSVDSAGMVTGKSLGTGTVTVLSNSLSASSQITVVAPILESIAVSPRHASIPLGENLQLSVFGKYDDGSFQNLKNAVVWSCSDSSVLSLSSSGFATPVSEGAVSVTGTSGSLSATAQIQVTPAVVTSLAIAPASSVLPLGGHTQLSATASFSDGTTQDVTTAVSWSSADPTIAIVGNGGMALAGHVGETTISASLGGIAGSTSFVVMPVMAVSYFSNAHTKFADATVRLTNPGITGGNLCAEIYVFDQDQQLTECCGCLLTPDGLRTLSVNTDLTGNPLTSVPSANGVLKIIPSDASANPSCDPTAISPTASLAAWSTNIQAQNKSNFSMTETSFQLTPLGNDELAAAQNQCSYAASLGSGQGICSCGTEGTAAKSTANVTRR